MESPKAWYKSKTIIFNLLLSLFPLVIENFSLLKTILPDSIYCIVLFVGIIGNGILRFITTQPIAYKQ